MKLPLIILFYLVFFLENFLKVVGVVKGLFNFVVVLILSSSTVKTSAVLLRDAFFGIFKESKHGVGNVYVVYCRQIQACLVLFCAMRKNL